MAHKKIYFEHGYVDLDYDFTEEGLEISGSIEITKYPDQKPLYNIVYEMFDKIGLSKYKTPAKAKKYVDMLLKLLTETSELGFGLITSTVYEDRETDIEMGGAVDSSGILFDEDWFDPIIEDLQGKVPDSVIDKLEDLKEDEDFNEKLATVYDEYAEALNEILFEGEEALRDFLDSLLREKYEARRIRRKIGEKSELSRLKRLLFEIKRRI